MVKQKIISGSFSYACRAAGAWVSLGYRIVKHKQWADGKWTFILEKEDDQ